MFGNEKSQKLNLNNLKSKRPLAVRENEKNSVCDCWGVYVFVPVLACLMCERVQVDVNNIRLSVLLYVWLYTILHVHDST